MKKFLVACLVVLVAVAAIWLSLLKVAKTAPFIDLYEMGTDVGGEYHTFGRWETSQPIFSPPSPPDQLVKLYINPKTGDYYGAGSESAFLSWLADCVFTPEAFTEEGMRYAQAQNKANNLTN